MRRIALFFVVLFTFAASAQNNGTMPSPHQMLSSPAAFADEHMAALEKQIGLPEELKPPLRSVFLREGKDLIAVLGDTSLSEAQKLARIRQVHLIAHNRVWILLTHGLRRPITPQLVAPRLVA